MQAIREFASHELALPDNGSFRRYADIGRSFVVWNVFATPELSLKPRESCFPIAGCVALSRLLRGGRRAHRSGPIRRRG
jgi:predicted aminopeptidase